MTAKLLTSDQVAPGDVLLCYSAMTAEEAQAGDTGYSHVAIALGERQVVEAASSGVRITDLGHLLDEYDHVAVMGSDDLWDQARLTALERFATAQQGKQFNRTGMVRVPLRKEDHLASLPTKLESHFEGIEPSVRAVRSMYFCSELVTAAFIHVGIIAPSAAVVISPEVMTPSDIGKDKAFGFFRGYLPSHDGYTIPNDDYFRLAI